MVREFVFADDRPFIECHASTIVELPDGDLLAAWSGGDREGHPSVDIWGARRTSAGWSAPEPLAWDRDTPCWNPVLFFDGQRVWLFYKLGPNPTSWTGAYRISNDLGLHWGQAHFLPAGLIGPAKNKPIRLSEGAMLCGSSSESWRAWACWVERIEPQSGVWERHGPIVLPDEPFGVIQPALWEAAPGRVCMLMRSTQRVGYVCRAESVDGGRTWGLAEPTPLPNPNSGIDAVKLADGRLVIAYNPSRERRAPLALAVSRDDGITFGAPIVLDTEPGELSYPAVIQGGDGALRVTYTWKRERIAHVTIPAEELDRLG